MGGRAPGAPPLDPPMLKYRSCKVSKCIEVYEGLRTLDLAKLINCNQIVGHVADQNYIAFID